MAGNSSELIDVSNSSNITLITRGPQSGYKGMYQCRADSTGAISFGTFVQTTTLTVTSSSPNKITITNTGSAYGFVLVFVW